MRYASRLKRPAWLTAFCFPSTTQKSSNYFFI